MYQLRGVFPIATIGQDQGRNVVVLKSLVPERKTYRFFRPIALPASLESLTGRRVGVVQLPVELDWGPNKTYDLSDPYFERQYYQTVIEETLNPAVFSQYLDGHRLVELWPTLWLSATLRDAWEAKFTELR